MINKLKSLILIFSFVLSVFSLVNASGYADALEAFEHFIQNEVNKDYRTNYDYYSETGKKELYEEAFKVNDGLKYFAQYNEDIKYLDPKGMSEKDFIQELHTLIMNMSNGEIPEWKISSFELSHEGYMGGVLFIYKDIVIAKKYLLTYQDDRWVFEDAKTEELETDEEDIEAFLESIKEFGEINGDNLSEELELTKEDIEEFLAEAIKGLEFMLGEEPDEEENLLDEEIIREMLENQTKISEAERYGYFVPDDSEL